MLDVCGLTKQYGGSMAIQDISFRVNKGEIVGLVGHNGCGKSTTMNIITGYLAADKGTVTLDGEDHVACAESVRRKIGYLPEILPLYPDMTVEEQLSFVCDLKRIPDKRDAIKRACQKTDITGVRGRLIRNLSKGYKQRIGLAQAVLGDPPLIVLDEPSSGLDPCQSAELRDMICETGKNHAILLSSHILSEVTEVCSRIVVLSNGHLVADDTPRALRQRFRTPGLYQLTASGDGREYCRLVREIAGFDEIKQLPCEEEGCFTIQFYTEDRNVAETAIALLARTDGVLIRFEPVIPQLEKVFLELTKDRRYEVEAR